jgi:hypothetical protein
MFPLDIIGVTNETRHEGVWHKEEKQKKDASLEASF